MGLCAHWGHSDNKYFMALLTFSFYFVGVSTPHYLPRVLLYLEGSSLRPLRLLLVEYCHDSPHLQAVKDAGTSLSPVQHPGGCDWSSGTPGATRGLLGKAIEAATESGRTHLQCIVAGKACRNRVSGDPLNTRRRLQLSEDEILL